MNDDVLGELHKIIEGWRCRIEEIIKWGRGSKNYSK